MIDTPIKRLGIVIMLIGLALASGGVLWVAMHTNMLNHFGEYLRDFWNEPFRGRGYNVLHIGLALSLLGLILSYLYDSTIGRLIDWIRFG